MKNLLLTFSLLFLTTLVFSQTVILDFEDPATSTDYQYFGSTLDGTAISPVANPDMSGINTSANVMMHEKPDGSEVWAGAFPNPAQTTALDFITATQLCVDVWSDNTGTVSLKLENSTTGGADWIQTGDITEAGKWTQVCLNVADASFEDPFAPAAGHVYGTVVIFFDFGNPGTGATYYFDNLITQGMGASEGDVTFSVDMNDYSDPFTTVYVSGTMNNWSGDANPLEDADGDGVWTGTIADIPVGTQEFKFTLDNWTAQEQFTGGETCVITDPSGQFTNRRLTVTGDAALDTYCFNSCYACGDAVRITVNVGTSHIAVDPAGMFIAGGGNFGNPGDNALKDDDGDGVWSMTFERQMGFESFYTLTNGACPDWSCKENIAGQDCADPNNFNDRHMGPLDSDITINTCFAICQDDTDCSGAGGPGDITFQIDMNGVSDPFTTVYISGTMNGWSGDANPLDDSDGDGIWEGTLNLQAGTYEYKVTYDNWTGQENFEDGEPCTITDPSGQFVNRALEVDGDATVCFPWNSCDSCNSDPQPGNITLRADMTGFSDPFTTVYLRGTFNAWGLDNPMQDDDGDGVWETTVMMTPGLQDFKFNVDENTWEEFVAGDPCTMDFGGFVNRIIEVDGDATYCWEWNTCTSCLTGTNDFEIDETLFSVVPTLVNDYALVNFNEEVAGEKILRVFNSTGILLEENTLQNGIAQHELHTGNLTSGIYLIYVQVGNKIATKKIVKQ